MKFSQRFLLVAFAVFLLAILVTVGALMTGVWLSKRELLQTMADLEKRGESFDPKSFIPPPAAKTDNGAPQIISASKAISDSTGLKESLSKVMQRPPIKPGLQTVKYRESLTPGGMDWNELREGLNSVSPLLDQIKQASAQPKLEIDLDYNKGMEMSLGGTQHLIVAILFLQFQAILDLHDARTADAIANISTLLRLSNLASRQPILICQRISRLCMRNAQIVTWEILQFPGITPEQLETLQAEWQKSENLRLLPEVLRAERAFAIPHFSDSPKNLRRILEIGSGSGASPLTVTALKDILLTESAYLAWYHLYRYSDEKEFIDNYQKLLDLVPNDAAQESWSKFLAASEELEYKINSYTVGITRPFNVTALSFLSNANHHIVLEEAVCRMTVVAIAIRRYQQDEIHPPKTLDDLVPKYLDAIPNDPIDGKPLRYQHKPPGFLIYSIGRNRLDDGGNPKDIMGKPFPNWTEGMDMVWPMPDPNPPPALTPPAP